MCTVGMHLDVTLGANEELRFRQKYSKLLRRLAKELPLDRQELDSLVIIYYKHMKIAEKKAMTKIQFQELLHSALDLTDSLSVFRVTATACKSIGPYVKLEEFIRVMALFLKGTFEEKIKFCYKCYVVTTVDATIRRDVMFRNLKGTVFTRNLDEDSDDIIRDLVDLIQAKMELHRDGKITLEEYKESVQSNSLLLEFLGPCVPSRMASRAFLSTFTDKLGKF
ncbi:EF-hand calcium-binding domain-containing protein 1-like [Agrilus planipennis]|uniref:EF-hand calcium-binding domain-containing protein 1-like n=1 Tax=Agrilus planipennis TaxID=224129 RepID=A0A1W4X5N1_AGRPL|nr:EF-hand calcium-binding domain-containing protein 1-like [Agrilus planipennis]